MEKLLPQEMHAEGGVGSRAGCLDAPVWRLLKWGVVLGCCSEGCVGKGSPEEGTTSLAISHWPHDLLLRLECMLKCHVLLFPKEREK